MPEKIIIKDPETGQEQEREYYSPDEVAKLSEDKANEIKAEYEAKIKEVEDGSNPDWKSARQKIKSLEEANKALAEQGKQIDNEGKIVDLQPKVPSYEEIETRARSAARQEQLSMEKERFLSQYDEETKKVIEHNYNKLTAGEQVTFGNMNQFLEQAEMLSVPNRGNVVKKAISYGRGGAPNKSEQIDFADTEEGKGLASSMGLKYVGK